MSIDELEEKIHRAVVRLSRTDDPWLQRIARLDIIAMRKKLVEMKGAALTAALNTITHRDHHNDNDHHDL